MSLYGKHKIESKMEQTKASLLNLLFNKGESVCVSPSVLGYHSVTQEDLFKDKLQMTPPEDAYNNKSFYIKPEEIQLIALNPIIGFRRDENVKAYRTFLVEIDFGALKEQYEYIQSLQMPYSVCIFSGSKSLHYGIVLDEDLPDESSYRLVSEWILKIVEKADQKTKNPSRSIRFGGNVRKETGRLMKVLELKKRVRYQDLMSWLTKFPDKDPRKDRKYTSNYATDMVYTDSLQIPLWVAKKLNEGIDESRGRNNEWFGIFMEFAKNGCSYDNMIDILEPYFTPERDFSLREWKGIGKSAYKRIGRNI
jgi:hypothetical protein